MSSPEFQWIRTPAGDLSCVVAVDGRGVALHSKFQPVQEAERAVRHQLSDLPVFAERIVIYGLGCGHHIRQVLRLTAEHVQVEVLEFHAAFAAEVQSMDDLQDILQHDRVQVMICERPEQLKNVISDWQHRVLHFVIHEPSVKMIPASMHAVRDALLQFHLQHKNMLGMSEQLEKNYRLNQTVAASGIDRFCGRFSDVPVVLVGAGPSLETTVSDLPELKKHCLIASVGRSLRMLVNHGVEPDLFMITDPGQVAAMQIRGLEHAQIPMFFLSTVFPGVPGQYQGPKFMVYQKGWSADPAWLSEHGRHLIDTGGSVATSLFDMLSLFGCPLISLIGMDLAYTDGKSHAQGAIWHRKLTDAQRSAAPTVPDFYGTGVLSSSQSLLAYRRWFMRAARRMKTADNRLRLVNASVGGAYIDGFEHASTGELLQMVKHSDATQARARLQALTNNDSSLKK